MVDCILEPMPEAVAKTHFVVTLTNGGGWKMNQVFQGKPWELIIANMDTKRILYNIARINTYHVRPFSSMVGEAFFSEVTLYDRKGQGTVTCDKFGQFIDDRETSHAVRFKQEKYCDHGDYSAEIHKEFTNEKAVINFDELLEDPWDCVKSTEKSSVAINMRNKVYSVTKADAVQSAASFDSLLTDKVWLRQFHKFLKFEYSEENIEFWIACEEFETVGTNELVATANKIYDTFIATFSPKEVNLDSKTRLEIRINLANPTRDLFKQAQKYVRLLLENDSYKRFLDSDIYRQFIADRCINSGY